MLVDEIVDDDCCLAACGANCSSLLNEFALLLNLDFSLFAVTEKSQKPICFCLLLLSLTNNTQHEQLHINLKQAQTTHSNLFSFYILWCPA